MEYHQYNIVTKLCENRCEREQAFRLTYDVYLRAGLTTPLLSEMRVLRHHLLDETSIIIAKYGESVISTLTLIKDTAFGLPLESLFADEIETMRLDKLCLSEISCLVSHAPFLNTQQKFKLLIQMFGLVIQLAAYKGVDRLLLVVHPKHGRLYQRLLGCEPISDTKTYDSVNGKPGVLYSHDLSQSHYPMMKQIYATKYPPEELNGTLMTEFEKQYFTKAMSHTTPYVVSID